MKYEYNGLEYDSETGEFIWVTPHPQATHTKSGDRAGTIRSDGRIHIRGAATPRKKVLAHRLAWYVVYGEWPPEHIDHIDGDPANNRIENLRLATPKQNAQNKRTQKNTKLGVKGVSVDRNKFAARIGVDGRRLHLGLFNTIEEASAAYQAAAQKYFGEYACLTR